MNKVDEYIRLKDQMAFTRDEKLVAFVDPCGKVLFVGNAPRLERDEIAPFGEWLRDIYLDITGPCPGCGRPRDKCTGQYPLCVNRRPQAKDKIDDQPMMTDIRDKHFAMDTVEKGKEE